MKPPGRPSDTYAASLTSAASETSMAIFSQKTMISSPLAPKLPILVPFWGLDHQKLLKIDNFLSEAVEASQCYFFRNKLIKLKRAATFFF